MPGGGDGDEHGLFGEILQTQRRRDFKLSRGEYLRVLEMKTAELFALSSELAGYLSGASSVQRSALRQFGLAFGTAYQIYDDCVDLFGSESAAGKSLGTDLAKGKLTLPVLMLWERAADADRARVEFLVQNWHGTAPAEMRVLLSRYDALASSIENIHDCLERSRQMLRTLPESDGRVCLFGLTEYLARQTDALADCA